MKLWNHYHNPTTVDEALGILQQYNGAARIIAGGTDLIIDLRAEGATHIQEALVDVTAIPELCDIQSQADSIMIGAGVTHAKIVKSPLILNHATCLVESCGVVGGPQVRNVGTLGGNVAHALPAGDGTTSLVALNAQAECIKDGVRQWRPIQEMFLGAGKSLLNSTQDILIRFKIPQAQPNTASAFKRIMRPQGVALPILGCAVWVCLDETRQFYEDARICLAPIAPTPTRAQEVEAALKGKPVNAQTLDHALQIAQETLHPRTSKYRATAAYRQEMIGVLLRRTVSLAAQRAQSGEIIPEGVGV